MGEIMNSPKGVKSDVPERVSISCPTCGIRHELQLETSDMSQLVNKPFNLCDTQVSNLLTRSQLSPDLR